MEEIQEIFRAIRFSGLIMKDAPNDSIIQFEWMGSFFPYYIPIFIIFTGFAIYLYYRVLLHYWNDGLNKNSKTTFHDIIWFLPVIGIVTFVALPLYMFASLFVLGLSKPSPVITSLEVDKSISVYRYTEDHIWKYEKPLEDISHLIYEERAQKPKIAQFDSGASVDYGLSMVQKSGIRKMLFKLSSNPLPHPDRKEWILKYARGFEKPIVYNGEILFPEGMNLEKYLKSQNMEKFKTLSGYVWKLTKQPYPEEYSFYGKLLYGSLYIFAIVPTAYIFLIFLPIYIYYHGYNFVRTTILKKDRKGFFNIKAIVVIHVFFIFLMFPFANKNTDTTELDLSMSIYEDSLDVRYIIQPNQKLDKIKFSDLNFSSLFFGNAMDIIPTLLSASYVLAEDETITFHYKDYDSVRFFSPHIYFYKKVRDMTKRSDEKTADSRSKIGNLSGLDPLVARIVYYELFEAFESFLANQ
ncbi:MAG: hypothetical protein JJT78_15275 [Leptospira sp.]|nr:hypothetical protein [Leptospira sp.]